MSVFNPNIIELIQYLKEGKRINAIKMVRTIAGATCGLKEAKDIVEAFFDASYEMPHPIEPTLTSERHVVLARDGNWNDQYSLRNEYEGFDGKAMALDCAHEHAAMGNDVIVAKVVACSRITRTIEEVK